MRLIMVMTPILVTGATGNVGREVVAQLISAGVPVRAFVRDGRTARLPHGVEIATGDLSEPETLKRALGGITTVFLVWPFLTAEGAPAVLDTIAGSARRLVYLSSSGVDEDAGRQTDPIYRLHAEMESLIKASGRSGPSCAPTRSPPTRWGGPGRSSRTVSYAAPASPPRRWCTRPTSRPWRHAC